MDILKQPRYNYFADLVRSQDDPQIRSLLELFAFGTLKQYNVHRDEYPELDDELHAQLARLSVLSLCNDYEGYEILIDNHLASYGLENEDIDSIVAFLVDRKVVEVKIDELERKWVIGKSNVIRDAYDARLHNLIVLREDEIAPRSVQSAKDYLQRWYKEKLQEAVSV